MSEGQRQPEGPSVGPDAGRELELMMAGQKPLSMFLSVTDMDEWPDEDTFDEVVAGGRLIKVVTTREVRCRDG